ncbi:MULTISPECIES: hypothetical protein [Nocardia]|uniref:hypothetical protein n=1 Tax=Nocardia TaxID=1817 RepID=UPI0007A3FF57|nr:MULTISPECIES: hypothetical protein [Nocardia]
MTIADALDQIIRNGVSPLAQADRHPPYGQLRTIGLVLYGELSTIVTLDDPRPALRTFVSTLREDIRGIDVLTPARSFAAHNAGVIEQVPIHILIASMKQNLITALTPILTGGAQ